MLQSDELHGCEMGLSNYSLITKKIKGTGERDLKLIDPTTGRVAGHLQVADGNGYIVNGIYLGYSDVAELLLLLQCLKELDKGFMENFTLKKLKKIKRF